MTTIAMMVTTAAAIATVRVSVRELRLCMFTLPSLGPKACLTEYGAWWDLHRGFGHHGGVSVPFLRRVVLVGVLTTLAALVAIDARATYGARISVDEPQYLLTAISLGEDLDLDISDELAEDRYLPFHERSSINEQTTELDTAGQRLSPHDPLLPALLAGPVRLGGWVGARIAMALLAGLTAALTLWTAVRRFAVPVGPATVVVSALFLSPPLIAFGNQIYPAMASALFVMLGVAVATGNVRKWWWLGALAVVALPWLSVKYAPHAAVLAVGLLWPVRNDRALVGRILGFLAVMGVGYLWFHRAVYGGWTVYAAGDHFVTSGEWEVVGSRFNPWGRTRRLVGLIVDRGFGLAAWAPVYLAMPLSFTWYVTRRRPHWPLLVGLVGVGWAVATWVALTMHGWWWPGRQVVPVLPLVAIALAASVARSARLQAAVVGASALAVTGWIWLVVEASTDRRTLIVDFRDTSWPWYRLWRTVLPDHQSYRLESVWLTLMWTFLLVGGSVAVWWETRSAAASDSEAADDPEPVEVSV